MAIKTERERQRQTERDRERERERILVNWAVNQFLSEIYMHSICMHCDEMD